DPRTFSKCTPPPPKRSKTSFSFPLTHLHWKASKAFTVLVFTFTDSARNQRRNVDGLHPRQANKLLVLTRTSRLLQQTIISRDFKFPNKKEKLIMAQEDLSVQVQQQMAEEEEQRLKYLEFVQVAAAHAAVCFLNLYGYAKERSGPLKPGVESVEGTVKNVVGPVYNKYHDVPAHLLTFVDRKVDQSVTKLDSRMPPVFKQASFKALSAAQKAPEAARAVASEVKRAGVVDTASSYAKSVYTKCEPAAKDLYAKYEPKAEQCAVSAWRKVNQVLPKVAELLYQLQHIALKSTTRLYSTLQRRGTGSPPICLWFPQRKLPRFLQGRCLKQSLWLQVMVKLMLPFIDGSSVLDFVLPWKQTCFLNHPFLKLKTYSNEKNSLDS
ncbi:Rubber elongation factor protein, partial [Prunus dulcis]